MINFEEIKNTIIYIECYKIKRFSKDFNCLDFFPELLERIADVLSQWSGKTYVGFVKDNITSDVFQVFFISLCDLIKFLEKNKDCIMKLESDFINSIKYNGIIYRILGYGDCHDKNKNKSIIPDYNSIFVSWSKNNDIAYLNTKLYGKKTKMKAYIDNDTYGIDLENFQNFINNEFQKQWSISKGEEREVVFPTLEEYITEIKYE